MGILLGKRALIIGLLSEQSIAFGIACALKREGAELAFTYHNEQVKTRVKKIANNLGSNIVMPCDVMIDSQITGMFQTLEEQWDGLDILIHSVAFAPSDQLKGDYFNQVTREGFMIAHETSSFSFVALAKAGMRLLENRKSSLLTLTYIGSEKVVPSYNVMGLAKASLEANVRYMAESLGQRGIRVNAISAGPVLTLAAYGMKNIHEMLEYHKEVSPLRENVTIDQIGNTAMFLCSELASGITGNIIYVDGGYHIMGMNVGA